MVTPMGIAALGHCHYYDSGGFQQRVISKYPAGLGTRMFPLKEVLEIVEGRIMSPPKDVHSLTSRIHDYVRLYCTGWGEWGLRVAHGIKMSPFYPGDYSGLFGWAYGNHGHY